MTWMAREHCLNQRSKPFNIAGQDDDISWLIAMRSIVICLVEQVEKMITNHLNLPVRTIGAVAHDGLVDNDCLRRKQV